ncbi:MAG: hypothetical protein ACRC1K_20290 [Planctomycetia bacterium]
MDWHRLFGLSWQDFFQDTAVEVEIERDLSRHQQFLDVVIHCPQPGPSPRPPPDGFADLRRYNLVTFKSYQEALDVWPLFELIGHYVNFRKQAVSPSGDLPPEDDFRLFAVCVRRPRELTKQGFLQSVSPGVYDVQCLTRSITVVVVHELPLTEHNALLHLFSAEAKGTEYGAKHYRPHSGLTSTLLLNFVERYEKEGLEMIGKELLEMHRETVKEVLRKAAVKDRLDGIPVAQRLEGIPVDQRLADLTDDELRDVPPEVREALVRRLLGKPSPPASP